MKIMFNESQNNPRVFAPLAHSYGRGDGGGLMKTVCSYLKIAYEKPFSPSPRLRGEGAGGEGPNCLETLPPHPGPLPRKAGGEGGNTRVTLQSFKTLMLPSIQHFHQATLRDCSL